MSHLYKLIVLAGALLVTMAASAQAPAKRTIIDALTGEPIAGASISCADKACRCGCASNAAGEFETACSGCTSHTISYMGYQSYLLHASDHAAFIRLAPVEGLMQEVVVSANREGVKRSEAPIAIASISHRTLQDAKPASIDLVLNKVSGVNMVSLGNEQHQMSIRQPMTTRSLFLYLEDGVPVRTTGLFNHNALLELNMAAVKSLEVIKGPSSSLYGSEAIGGVVNFITLSPTAVPLLKLSAQGSNQGYRRADVQSSFSRGRWGFVLSGYHARRRDGYLPYSDFHKSTLTARADYRFSPSASLSNSVTWLDYDSDMSGSIDSAMFAARSFKNLHSFTYRKVRALRYRSSFSKQWSEGSKTTATLLYRDNAIGQNPAYRVKDDYRKVSGRWTGKKDLAHGEINDNTFRSYSFTGQHRQALNWKRAVAIGGVSVDGSPSGYDARYIRIAKDTVANKYVSYQATDSILTDYATNLNNYAAFGHFEFSPLEKLRVVASLRYDLFRYRFDNALTPSAFSGSADTVNHFYRLSPKVGATYNFSARTGLYANYSEGFVPPQVTELYTGVKVPSLEPSVFYNWEVGGWAEVIRGKLSADVSLYQLEGTNEVVSVRLDDGTTANRNAGRTAHKGIELGVNATPAADLTLRLSGAWSEHRFTDYVEKGTSYNGNAMNGAPRWLCNAEAWYKPSFLEGLRLGVELQHVGAYWADPQNTARYGGHDVLNLRLGYAFRGVDVWVHALNAANAYYATIVSKSAYGYSYTLAEPRNITLGLSYDFANLFKKN
ncbi:MAG TPA: TonB-dependent receptor [Chitinophagaceae bacterium]